MAVRAYPLGGERPSWRHGGVILMAKCDCGGRCYVCHPYTTPTPESLWPDYCMMCNNDYASPGSCKHCVGCHEKLKARRELPRRREAVMATRKSID